MARGRIIKPEFWTDGNIVSLSLPARLFYIGLWNFALCDAGHLPDDPQGLKLKIFPADQVEAQELVDELLASGRLQRMSLPGGRSFLHIRRFSDHQKADTRWSPRCPVCQNLAEPQPNSPEFESTQPSTPELTVEGIKEESTGGEKSATEVAPPRRCPAHLNSTTSPACGACRDARLAREDWDKAQKLTPTPIAPRVDLTTYCTLHPEYPNTTTSPCARCAREAAEALTERAAS